MSINVFTAQDCIQLYRRYGLPGLPEIGDILISTLEDMNLEPSPENLDAAYRLSKKQINQFIDSLSAKEYAERVVKPTFRAPKTNVGNDPLIKGIRVEAPEAPPQDDFFQSSKDYARSIGIRKINGE